MTARLLADDILVLSLDPASGRPWRRFAALNCGLAGALLADLALAGRVQWERSRIFGAQAAPSDDDALAKLAERVATDPRRRTVAWWVRTLQGRKLRRALLRRAVDTGVLRTERRRGPAGVCTARYFAADPAAADALRVRLRPAVQEGRAGDARTAALVALVGAMGLDGRLFPDVPREERHRQIAAAVADDQVSASVRSSIRHIRFATAAAVTWGLLQPVLPF